MECMAIETNDEVVILKKKCNTLLDMIDELKNEVKEKEDSLKNTESYFVEEFKNSTDELLSEPVYFDESEELYLFLQSLKNIIKKVLENNSFIEYSYSSKYSSEYCKIEKSVFNSYITELASIDEKKFIEYCIDFLYLKAEHTRKCIYTSDKKQIYYIRRSIVKILGAELYGQNRQRR